VDRHLLLHHHLGPRQGGHWLVPTPYLLAPALAAHHSLGADGHRHRLQPLLHFHCHLRLPPRRVPVDGLRPGHAQRGMQQQFFRHHPDLHVGVPKRLGRLDAAAPARVVGVEDKDGDAQEGLGVRRHGARVNVCSLRRLNPQVNY